MFWWPCRVPPDKLDNDISYIPGGQLNTTMVRHSPVARQLFASLSALALLLLSISGAKAQDGVPVGVAESETRTIFSQLQVTGTVTSARSARLSAATSGQVAAISVDAGSRVTTGDVLLTLDPEIPELEYPNWMSPKHCILAVLS